MLNLYEIELVAGGWGTTGETLDGMPIDDDNHITVTGRLPGIPALGFSYGYGGPETGNSYPGDPADLGAGNMMAANGDWPDWLKSLYKWAFNDKSAELEKKVAEKFDPLKVVSKNVWKGTLAYHMEDGTVFIDTDGNGTVDAHLYRDRTGLTWVDKGEGPKLTPFIDSAF